MIIEYWEILLIILNAFIQCNDLVIIFQHLFIQSLIQTFVTKKLKWKPANLNSLKTRFWEIKTRKKPKINKKKRINLINQYHFHHPDNRLALFQDSFEVEFQSLQPIGLPQPWDAFWNHGPEKPEHLKDTEKH